jgi:hypothetical protein
MQKTVDLLPNWTPILTSEYEECAENYQLRSTIMENNFWDYNVWGPWFILVKRRGKAVPVAGRAGPEGCELSMFP